MAKTKRLSVVAVLLALLLAFAPLTVLADGYGAQGGDFKINMIDPAASEITTTTTDTSYWNVISTGYDSENTISFTADMGDGGGTNHIDTTAYYNSIKLYSDKSLSDDSLVYNYDADCTGITVTNIGAQQTLNRGARFRFDITGLEKASTYYLVFKQGLKGTTSDTTVIVDKDIVFEFNTMADASAVDSVALDQKSIVLDGLDQKYKLAATVSPETAADKTVTWSSSDTSVATVGNGGNVKAVKAGTATITATTNDGGKTASCKVLVKKSDNGRVLAQASGTKVLESGAKYMITNPDVYTVIGSDNQDYFVIPENASLDALPEIAMAAIPNGGRKGTTFKVNVYDDAELKNVAAALDDGVTLDIPDYTAFTSKLDASKFEEGKTYYFVVEANSTCGAVPFGKQVVIEFTVAPKVIPLEAALTADPETGSASDEVTIKADAKGGTAPYKYTFTVKDNASGSAYTFAEDQDEDSCAWHPGPAGEKTLTVVVTDSEGETAEASVPYTVNEPDELQVASFDAGGENSFASGDTVELKAAPKGGVGPYEYKFIVYNELTDSWYRIQDFSSEDTCSWYTGTAANKQLFVDIRDSWGHMVRGRFDVMITTDLRVTGFSSSKGASLAKWNNTTLTANAAGGSGSYTYKFIVHNKTTDSWYKIRDFESGNSIDWNGGPAGNKELFVDVKDSYGNVVRKGLNVTVK